MPGRVVAKMRAFWQELSIWARDWVSHRVGIEVRTASSTWIGWHCGEVCPSPHWVQTWKPTQEGWRQLWTSSGLHCPHISARSSLVYTGRPLLWAILEAVSSAWILALTWDNTYFLEVPRSSSITPTTTWWGQNEARWSWGPVILPAYELEGNSAIFPVPSKCPAVVTTLLHAWKT